LHGRDPTNRMTNKGTKATKSSSVSAVQEISAVSKKEHKKPKNMEVDGEETEEQRQQRKKEKKEKKRLAKEAEEKEKAQQEAEEKETSKEKKKKSKKEKEEKEEKEEKGDGKGTKRKRGDAADEDEVQYAKKAPVGYKASEESKFRKEFYSPAKEILAMTPAEVAAYRQELNLTVTNDGGIVPIKTFAQTGLPAKMLQITKGFKAPTPIQAQCWPALLAGRDVIGIAETGSGKTLGFVLPALIHILDQKPVGKAKGDQGPIVLVLSPTRELAMQTHEVCESAGAQVQLKSVCIYGGMPKDQQKAALRAGVHFVVATPGRLLSLINEGHCSLARVTYLCLDEADRMLDMGFEPDIRAIIGNVRTDRQTMLFSATWPKEIQALGREFVNNPLHLTVGTPDELTANHRVKQTVEVIDEFARDRRLVDLLKNYHSSRKNKIIIFVLYKKEVGRVENMLKRQGWAAVGISSDKNQYERTKALEDFKSGAQPLLIATDVAARGLDINDVEHVINYSMPLTIEDYVHRIGRTGRGGKNGNSHTFFTKNDKTLSGELINILKEANENVPEELTKFGVFTKKKAHPLFGMHYKGDDDGKPMPVKKHMKFD